MIRHWVVGCGIVVAGAALGAVPTVADMRGPFPIMSTPYLEDGAVDYAVLAKEAQWTSDSGCPGVIWCQSNDAVDLLTTAEKFKGFEACAGAVEGRAITLALGANGTNTAQMLEIAAEIERVAERHPAAKIAMVSRPPDDVRSEAELEAAWDALGKVAKRPVIFQTFGTDKTPTPSVELLVRLAERHPHAFGYVKEEAAGDAVLERMLQENAAKPPMKAVFSGWGGWKWLLQLRQCGSVGLVTERCAVAPLLGELWRRYEKGERGAKLAEAYAMYRLLIDQRDFPGGMRGYALYLLQKEGVFKNRLSRQYKDAKVTEGGSFGESRAWKLEDVTLTDIQKAELDLLYKDMLDFVKPNPWLAPLLAVLPLVGCIGLLFVVILCVRSKGFAQFVKYGANGVIATYVQTGLFYLLASTWLLCLGPEDWAVQYLGLTPAVVSDSVRAFRFAVATGAGFLVANVVCWLMNRCCVFTPGKYRWYVEFGMFFAAATIATVLALGLSSALIHWAGLMTSVAVVLEIVISFLVNFFVRKFVIFKG